MVQFVENLTDQTSNSEVDTICEDQFVFIIRYYNYSYPNDSNE